MLNADQIEKLRPVLHMAGWREIIRPVMEGRKKRHQEMAFMLPSQRPEPYKSMEDSVAVSVLRGQALELEWLLSQFESEVAIFDLNRMRDEKAREESNAG